MDELLTNIDCKKITPAGHGMEISGISCDSRECAPGFLFAAMNGAKSDGHGYILDALKRGAVAFMVDEGFEYEKLRSKNPSAVFLTCSDTRKSFGIAAANFYGNPSSKIKLVGVTGTNGKTTITYLINSILEKAGRNTGLIGTIIYKIGPEVFPSSLTTPDSGKLQRFFGQMIHAGVDSAIIEVSSHAVHMKRIAGCEFDVGIFTNLTSEHMDFHSSMEDYYLCKKDFFLNMLSQDGKKSKSFVINIDDPWGKRLVKELGVETVTYSMNEPDATVSLVSVISDSWGIDAKISIKGNILNIRSPLSGRFNIYNIMAAAGACWSLGVEAAAIEAGIEELQVVPGRFQRIENNQGIDVIVDYAHTPDAIEKLLTEARRICECRLITVFGCGGDRDRSKRPLMGELAGRLSDLVFVTSDNPRSEDPQSIISEILSGMTGGMTGRVAVVEDRSIAIESAIMEAEKGDMVIIAGKGHEDYQLIGGKIINFDDREEAGKALEKKKGKM